jgi:hypothetical protein
MMQAGFCRIVELHPAVIRQGPRHLDEGLFDPLGDLRLPLVRAALVPVDSPPPSPATAVPARPAEIDDPRPQNRRFPRLRGERTHLSRPWRYVRFARHAKNEMRWKGWAQSEVLWVISNPVKIDADAYGHPRYFG